MGLDQYAISRDSKGENKELAYWRKHNRLQGFMESLWTLKTGKGEDELNCEEMELTESDLNLLETSVKERSLPATQGFFFGSDSYERETDGNDLLFITKARAAIKNGEKVFYSCWW